ncbi:sigma-E factor negative regulatory protein [Halopseudomonas pelagia]|uniref:sigma-E factor negative regulatory protein n=1 Tax=Halopseudomonas pelagia TaxID=553151 RepID=UPI0030DA7906
MSNQSLQESLSALMDNEADELEIRRVLQASESDPAMRSTWDRYQMARAIMHKEPWQPKIDLSAGIAALIADEAPVMVERKSPRVWQNLSRLAVAASVTLAVLVGVNMFNQDGSPADPAMLAELPAAAVAPAAVAPSAPVQPTPVQSTQGGAVLAGFSSQSQLNADASAEQKAPSAWQEQRIGTYLRQHAEHSSRFEAPQLLPYARAASLENQ